MGKELSLELFWEAIEREDKEWRCHGTSTTTSESNKVNRRGMTPITRDWRVRTIRSLIQPETILFEGRENIIA